MCVTDHDDMTLAVEVALNSNTTNYFLYFRLFNAEKKKIKVFAALKKNERDKKKLQESVLKQLKGLVNGQTASIAQS